MNTVLHRPERLSGASLVVASDAVTEDSEIGGKARSLAVLERAGFPVPAWFVVTPDAYLASEVDAGAADAAGDARAPSPDVVAAIACALERLCPNGEPVAVRTG